MSKIAARIAKQLRSEHDVSEFFYPDISIDLDLPNGLQGEVDDILELLDRNGFQTTLENVLQIMKLKRSLILRYKESNKGKRILEEYNNLLRKHIKPVGITIPLELLFASGIGALLIFVGARFLGSFADEAGKIAARRLLGDEKEVARNHNMNLKEYQFIRNQTLVLIENEDEIISLIKKLVKERE